jgi:Zn-dependent protease
MPLALTGDFFFLTLFREPVYFFSVLFTVVVSIVLHELGHGFAALGQGDDTPKAAGHLTVDPLVHMGGFSLLMLLLVGIAWGQTPVNPSRFRHRHGDAWVSLAGPLVNVVLAFGGLTLLGLWIGAAGPAADGAAANGQTFLFVFGSMNVVLFLFNMVPIPPLDGSNVVASFVPPYRRLVRDPNNQGVFFALFLVVFFTAGYLFKFGFGVAHRWVALLAG